MNEADRNRKQNLWLFPLGTVGRDMLYQLFTNFLLVYVLFTRQLTAAQLMTSFRPSTGCSPAGRRTAGAFRGTIPATAGGMCSSRRIS